MRVTPWALRRSARNDVRRRRFFGLLGSQTPQPNAGRGTPPDEPQPKMVNFNVMADLTSCGTCKIVCICRGRVPRDLAEQPEEIVRGLLRQRVECGATGFR